MALCIKIDWAAQPDVRPCAVGEPVDYRGLKIVAVYDGGVRKVVDVSPKMLNESDLQSMGPVRRSLISFEGKRLFLSVPIIKASLERIEVLTKDGFTCREGELVDRDNLVVTAFYSDGTSREVSHYKVLPFDPLTTDVTEVTVRYGRRNAVLPVEVLPSGRASDVVTSEAAQPTVSEPEPHSDPPILASVEDNERDGRLDAEDVPGDPGPKEKVVQLVAVVKPPDRLRYTLGEKKASLAGGQLCVLYTDGSTEFVPMPADIEGAIEGSRPGPGLVIFQHLGKLVSYAVEISDLEIAELIVRRMPDKLEYAEGEPVDLAGLRLDAVYSDGSVKEASGITCDITVGAEHAAGGVPVSYNGHQFTIPITIKQPPAKPTPVAAVLAQPPDKTTYIESECIYPDLTGAELLVHMSDGGSERISVTQDMVAFFDISKPGSSSLDIEYFTFKVSQPIVVEPRSLRSIVVGSPPKKSSYIHNEKFDLQGAVIYAVYNNGTKEVISDYELDRRYAAAGDTAIIFKYRGKTTSFPVSIQPLTVQSLDWIKMPDKLEYSLYEKDFSCEGGLLRIKRNDGSVEDIPLDLSMVAGFKTSRLGPLPLRVTCAGKTIPLSVTIKDRVLIGLQVLSMPRLEYMVGESFDPTGLTVEAIYTGGSREVVAVNYLPYGELNETHESVMLIYRDKAAVLQISVKSHDEVIHRPLDISYPECRAPTNAALSDPTEAPPFARGHDLNKGAVPADNSEHISPAPDTGEPLVSEPGPVLAEGIGEGGTAPDTGGDAGDSGGEDKGNGGHVSLPVLYPSSFCIRFTEPPPD